MPESQRLDYIPVTFSLGAPGVDSATRLGTGQKWLNGPLTLVGPRAEIQGPGGAYLKSTGTDPSNAQIELRLTGAVDDSKIQLTEGTLTLEGGTAVEITANDGGTVSVNSVTHIDTTGQFPTTSSTNAPLTVGTYTAGDYKIRVGTRSIIASEGDLTSDLNLNRTGGAVLIRARQVAPALNIGTPVVGSGASVTSTTQEFAWQAGKNTVSFTAGAGSFNFPTTFPNGVITFLATPAGSTGVTLTWSAVTAVTASLFCQTPPGTNFTGSLVLSWLAIGW